MTTEIVHLDITVEIIDGTLVDPATVALHLLEAASVDAIDGWRVIDVQAVNG